MKIRRVSEHIWSVKAWRIIPIHVWLVAEQDGITLVDAGMPFMAKGIQRYIAELAAGPLQRIVLTHGHLDHVGAIKKLETVPVFAHHLEIPYMTGEKRYPKRKKLECNVAKEIIQPLKEADGKLSKIGALTPYFTPGHAPGHVAYYHETDQVLLAGDLFTSKSGKLHQPMPMFTADMAAAVKSSEILAQLKPKQLEICHGNPVIEPANQWEQYVKKMEKKLS